MRKRWPGPGTAVTDGPEGEGFAAEHFYKTIRYLTAVVETFIDDERFFIPWRVELAYQFILSVDAGTAHVNVAHLAVGCVFYTFSIGLNPRQMTQALFIDQCLHNGRFSAGPSGRRVVCDLYGFFTEALKECRGFELGCDRYAVN